MRLFLVLTSSLVVAASCGSSTGVLSGGGGATPVPIGSGNTTTGSGGDGMTAATGGAPTGGGSADSGTGGGPGQVAGSGGAGSQSASGGAAPDGGAGRVAGGGGSATGGSPGSSGGTGGIGSGGHLAQGSGGAGSGTGGGSSQGSGGSGAGHTGASGGAATATGGSGSGGNAAGSGGAATATGGSGSGGSAAGSGGAAGGGSAAGNPSGSCSTGVPAAGHPADVSKPTTVVGSGAAGSCTFAALAAAVAKAGVITFDCGSGPVTIAVTSTMNLSTTKDTVIDGGNRVTLDGGHAVQIFNYDSPNFQATETRVTLQHLTVVNGKTAPSEAIPAAPQAACSQGFNDGQGGALFMRDGNLTIIDCTFSGNQAAPLGPDTGGGAIYLEGSKHGALIVGSTFTGNSGANAGAVGALFAELDIYDSLFSGNAATGHDANNDDATMCSAINNGQNEIGSGGNGGAIYGDGNSFDITLCGDAVIDNSAGKNAFGGGLFFTSDNWAGVLTITDTTMSGNSGGHWTSVKSGSADAGSAVGVNAKSVVITSSTLQ